MTTRPAQKRHPNALQAFGLLMGAAAAFPAMWWLMGKVNDSGSSILDPDYAVKPPQLDGALTDLVGPSATVIVMSLLLALFVGFVSAGWRRGVAGVVLPLVVGFGYLGATAQVATAPVIGANIGAVLMATGALPVVCVAVAVMFVSLRSLRSGADYR